MQYIYGYDELNTAPEHPTSAKVAPRRVLSGPTMETGKSSTIGAVLYGEHIAVALAGQAAGSGAKAHTHPNEQFNYILQGVMVSDIDNEKQTFGPKGTIVHTPSMSVHTGQACPDEDMLFFAMKDTRHGITGPPVDGKYDGPLYLPGFGKRAGEPKKATAQMMAESGTDPEGAVTRYIYDFNNFTARPGRNTSARMVPDVKLASGVAGGLLISEKLQVAVINMAPGATLPTHQHDNEQFTLVAEGDVHAYVAGKSHRVGERFVIHVPPHTSHGIIAGSKGARIVTVQDTRFAFAG
ncbi:MAG TPA: cupin domain-containing protein [Burkholderiales bacterium]|nr:cupin domain-containing protein [Burkholderiales bacterium]